MIQEIATRTSFIEKKSRISRDEELWLLLLAEYCMLLHNFPEDRAERFNALNTYFREHSYTPVPVPVPCNSVLRSWRDLLEVNGVPRFQRQLDKEYSRRFFEISFVPKIFTLDLYFSIEELMITGNTGLSIASAKKYYGKIDDFDDNVLLAQYGLSVAYRKFDVYRGLAFSTYAGWMIKRQMRIDVRVDNNVQADDSLDVGISLDDDDTFHDKVMKEESLLDDHLTAVQRFEILLSFYSLLNDRDQNIFRWMFHLDEQLDLIPSEPLTCETFSQVIGMSKSWVSKRAHFLTKCMNVYHLSTVSNHK